MEFFLFIVGFILLIGGAKYLVDGASTAGVKLGLSQLIIGLTVVAIGTSLPELIINVFASVAGNTELAISNVVGSNLMNTMLIAGIAAMIYPIKAGRSIYRRDVWINLLAVMVMIVLANDHWFFNAPNVLQRFDGGILLVFVAYVLYLIFAKSSPEEIEQEVDTETKHLSWPKLILFILGGVAGLYFGGRWIVGSATIIGSRLGISDSMLGMTVVAIATSLPELVTSIVAALKKNTDIALGNVLGSNIFNIFLVLGVSAVIHPIPYESTYNTELFILLLSGLFITLLIYTGKTSKTISRFEGGFLVIGYLAFLTWTIAGAL